MFDAFHLSQADSRPMYTQIMDKVKELVVSKAWAPGYSLPSIREMAAGLNVSVITVKRAYQELEREGVIVTRHGMGSFIANQTEAAIEQKREELMQHFKHAHALAQLLEISDSDLIKLFNQFLQDTSAKQEPKQ